MAKNKRPTQGAKSKSAPLPPTPLVKRPDIRRWIYAALDLVFAVIYFILATRIALTQSPLDRFQLLTLPVFAAVMAAGMLISKKHGWWISVIGCSALLISAVIIIARILISISFLAAVYGGFGKAASSFALLAVALIVEVVVLLPLFQLKYLLSRAGRRSLGVMAAVPPPARAAA